MAGSARLASEDDRARESSAEDAGPAAKQPTDTGLLRRCVAEVFGTFALVFAAAGADTMALASGGQVSVAARAVAPGLIVAAMIYALSDESGAHLNPSVTLAFVLRRDFPAAWLLPYWVAEVSGALIAALILRALFGNAAAAGVSTPHVASGTAVAVEVVLTLLLVTVILGTTDRARRLGPDAAIAVGGTIAACGLMALPITGASMNPARSLGPAVVNGRLEDLWIYLLGPLIGASIAAIGIALVRGPRPPDAKTREAAQGKQTA
jgi:aquaporin Z